MSTYKNYRIVTVGTEKLHLAGNGDDHSLCGYAVEGERKNRVSDANCGRCWRIYENVNGEGPPQVIEAQTEADERLQELVSTMSVLSADIKDGKLHVALNDPDTMWDLVLDLEEVRKLAIPLIPVTHDGQKVWLTGIEVQKAYEALTRTQSR